MFAKINHVAIVSENYALSARFYEAMFGMRTARKSRPARAVTVGDGYVGLNINPRKPGRPARLDHFGVEVADMEEAFSRLSKKYPEVRWSKRPATRPYAAVTTHDPDGNVFDLSQQNVETRKDIYVEGSWEQARHISHIALRTLHPERMAEFYARIFELSVQPAKAGDANHYLSDGRITLVIMPWDINDYDGTGIVSPAMDHIGFAVDDLEAFKREVREIGDSNPLLAPVPVGTGVEGATRLELFRRSCPFGRHHLSDVDGVLLCVGAH